MKQNYKKSILGLNTVKAFIVVLLSLAIIAIVTLVVLGAFNTPTLVATGGRAVNSVVVNNESITPTTSGTSLSVAGLNSVTCNIVTVINGTSTVVTQATNYTVSNCIIANTTNRYVFSSQAWNVTYTYSYRTDADFTAITNNVSNGIIGFFANSSTYFALLGVVVIILIISLVVVVVNRFGGGAGTDDRPSL